MLTSVHTEILDDSISGDKLAGGTVNPPFELMYAYRIITGNSLTKGISITDSVTIGGLYGYIPGISATALPSDAYLRYLRVFNRASNSIFDILSPAGNIVLRTQGSSTLGGYIDLYTGATPTQKTHLSNQTSWFLNQVIIGASSTAATEKLVIIGGINADYITVPNIITNLPPPAVSGNLEAYLGTLVTRISDTETLLSGFQTGAWAEMKSITQVQYNYISVLDQYLQITADVIFNSLTLSNGIHVDFAGKELIVVTASGVYLSGPDGSGGLVVIDESVRTYKPIVADEGITNVPGGAGIGWDVYLGTTTISAGSVAIPITFTSGNTYANCLGYNCSIQLASAPKLFYNSNSDTLKKYETVLNFDSSPNVLAIEDAAGDFLNATINYQIIVYFRLS